MTRLMDLWNGSYGGGNVDTKSRIVQVIEMRVGAMARAQKSYVPPLVPPSTSQSLPSPTQSLPWSDLLLLPPATSTSHFFLLRTPCNYKNSVQDCPYLYWTRHITP